MESIDKIVLSKDRTHCCVYLVSGVTLHFNFMKLGMTYFEGISWLEGVFNGTGTKQAA